METLGRYTLVRKLATGGMAEVFLASADGPGGFSKELVVKRILPHFADNPQFVQMFLSEAKLAAQLNHPNIVQVFDFGEASGHYYLAMEYVDGPNLRTLNRIFRERYGEGMPPAACARIISQACEGLAYAHSFKDPQTRRPVNLIHRDISPDNLIISKHGAVKVLDFGIAKAETQSHKTSTGMLKGKMAYMPPEQLQREVLDMRVDIYALGVVLYELVAGALPFDATSEVSIIQAVMKPEPLPPLHDVLKDIPEPLDRTVARALAKSRGNRYPDCKALQNDLESFVVASGEKWLSSDLAELVARGEETDRRHTDEEMPVVATSTKSATYGDLPSSRAKGSSGTFIRPVSGTGISDTRLTPVKEAKGPAKAIIGAVIGLLVIAAGATTFIFLNRQSGGGDTPIVVPPPPAKVVTPTVVDAGATVVATPTPTPEPAVEDAGATEVATPTPTPAPPEKNPTPAPHHSKGEVEVRVRPFAMLYVDGEQVGQTPLDKPLTLSAGKHKFRMVNEQYNKDVVVEFTVKPGKSQFKYNLME